MLISVIIPTHNRAHLISQTLDAILDQNISHDLYEIIVVDNNSVDNTKEVVNQYVQSNKNLRYIFESKSGASPTRNSGARKANSDILLFLDDDMIAESNLLTEHIKSHENHFGSVLGFFKDEWGDGDNNFLKYLNKSGVQNKFPEKDNSIVGYEYFYTGCISVRKDLFDMVNGFDENFQYYGVEDIDLGYRMYCYGNKILYNKNAITHHKYTPDYYTFKQKRFFAGKSLRYFLNKFPHLKTQFFFEPFAILSLPILNLIFILLYPFALIPNKNLNWFQYNYYYWSIRLSMFRGYIS